MLRTRGLRSLLLLASLSLAGGGRALASGLSFAPSTPIPLPPDFAAARDLRWRDGQTLVLAVSGTGVVEATWNREGLARQRTLVPQGPPPGIVIASKLALSGDYVAVSAGMSEMLWQPVGDPALQIRLGSWWPDSGPTITDFDDIDVRGDELAIRGLIMSRAEMTMAPDGAVAWRARFGEPTTNLQPFAYSLTGRGARPFEACQRFDHSHVRFLADGRLALVPGAEPGIQIYSTAGRLERTFDTSRFAVDLRCDFPDEEWLRYAGDELAREDRLATFTTVDEIIPTAEGLLVLVKPSSTGGVSRWRAYLLRDDGSILDTDLPWHSDWKYTRISGDQRDGRIILLLSDRDPGNRAKAGRLVETRLLLQDDTAPPPKR